MTARDAAYFIHLIFRSRVDAFMLSCIAAGLITLGVLPEDPSGPTISAELAFLASRRQILDADMKAVADGLPPAIRAALELPSAHQLVSYRTPILGSFDVACAEVQYLLLFMLLRLEIHMGLFMLLRLEIHMGHGIAAREAALRDTELPWTLRHEIIAEEFSRGGVTTELCETVS